VKPHPLVITALTQVEDVIPKWKIVPTKDVIDAAFKDPAKREKVGEIKYCLLVHQSSDILVPVICHGRQTEFSYFFLSA
jgi:hypothetical protein